MPSPNPKKKSGLVFDVTPASRPAASKPAAAASKPVVAAASKPATSKPAASKPASKPAPSKAREQEPEDEEKDVFAYRKAQRSVWLSERIHSEAKVLAARLKKKSLREYIEGVVRKDLEAHGISVPEEDTT